MQNMVKFGPKYMKGTIWDEGGKTNILQIIISHDKYTINSIQFVYAVDSTRVVRSEVHGETTGLKLDIVTFDRSGEYLVYLSGQNNRANGKLVSIAFGTSKRTYEPFGSADDPGFSDKFVYNFRERTSFGGFHGSVFNSCVYAIGVYVKPLGSPAETGTDNNILAL